MKTKNYITLALAGFFGLALITSCGGGGKTGTESTEATEQATATEPTAEQMALGEKIFKEKIFSQNQP